MRGFFKLGGSSSGPVSSDPKSGSPMGCSILFMGLKRKRHIQPINFAFVNALFSLSYVEKGGGEKENGSESSLLRLVGSVAEELEFWSLAFVLRVQLLLL